MIDLLHLRTSLFSLIVVALKEKFAGSLLGVGWLVIFPLMFLSIYSTVFYFILGVRIPELGTIEYILTIFCGLVPFLAISEALNQGVGSLLTNKRIILSTMLPFELLVVRDVIVSAVSMSIGLVLVCGFAFFLGELKLTAVLIPIIVLFQLLMTIGLVAMLAVAAILVRDLSNLIPMLTLVLMLVSPIAYTSDMVPINIRYLSLVNPLAWFIDLYQQFF